MPVSYKFVNRETGEAVPLNKVDNEVCAYLGIEASETENSDEFNALALAGLNAAFQTGETNEENVEAMIARTKIDETFANVCREFLYRRYIYHAWRGGF